MSKRLAPATPTTLDETDRALLAALAADTRQPVSELARRVGLSAPSTAERVRRLEAQGVIERFTVQIDPRALGFTLQAIVRVKPLPGQMKQSSPVTLSHSIEQLDEILSKVTERAETSTAIVKSTPVARRLPPLG